MRRSHIHVVHSSLGWEVKLVGRNVTERFSRKAQALRAATRAAEALWSEDGVPTDVSVQVAPGQWRDERKFG